MTGGSEVQGHSQLQSEFEASFGFMRLDSKTQPKKGREKRCMKPLAETWKIIGGGQDHTDLISGIYLVHHSAFVGDSYHVGDLRHTSYAFLSVGLF